jgi:membrane protease YdiL (CAAX protease family)
MTTFQQLTLLLTAIWLGLILIRFRRSTLALLVGLLAIGLHVLLAILFGFATKDQVGLGAPGSWWVSLGFAFAGLAVTLAWSGQADRLASRWFKKKPTLGSFRVIRQSKAKLAGGIILAWILGGFLEELIARGVVLNSLESYLRGWLGVPAAAAIAICVAAAGAGILHLYQGSRAAFIIAQLSILFGVLFVVSGYNLWPVVISHGLYDTIAFVRFASGKSRYSSSAGRAAT